MAAKLPMHHSMVKFLQDKEKSFCLGEIHCISGQYFNNQVKDFSGEEDISGRRPNFYRNGSGLYVYELPKANVAIVPNPTGIYIGELKDF